MSRFFSNNIDNWESDNDEFLEDSFHSFLGEQDFYMRLLDERYNIAIETRDLFFGNPRLFRPVSVEQQIANDIIKGAQDVYLQFTKVESSKNSLADKFKQYDRLFERFSMHMQDLMSLFKETPHLKRHYTDILVLLDFSKSHMLNAYINTLREHEIAEKKNEATKAVKDNQSRHYHPPHTNKILSHSKHVHHEIHQPHGKRMGH